MKLDEIESEWTTDCKIDDTELDTESLKIPQLHNKYLKIYNQENLTYKKLSYQYNELEKVKYEYYYGKMCQEDLDEQGWEQFDHKLLKQDVPRYLESDSQLIAILMKMDLQKEKVEFLKSIISSINSRNWQINNAIKWRQFINGIG